MNNQNQFYFIENREGIFVKIKMDNLNQPSPNLKEKQQQPRERENDIRKGCRFHKDKGYCCHVHIY
jgi:hypothetical protein